MGYFGSKIPIQNQTRVSARCLKNFDEIFSYFQGLFFYVDYIN